MYLIFEESDCSRLQITNHMTQYNMPEEQRLPLPCCKNLKYLSMFVNFTPQEFEFKLDKKLDKENKCER